MMIPQIKSTLISVAVILVGVPLAECYHLYLSGELHGWSGLPDVLNHASFTAVMCAVGWILLKSPFAPRFTEMVVTKTADKDGVSEKTVTKMSLSEPAARAPDPPAA